MAQGETGPFKGTVISLNPKGLIVELADTLQQGMLPYYALGGARFVLAADGLSATAHPGRTYRLGQTVEVDLAGVDESLRRVDFGLPGAPRRASSRPAGRAPHAAHKRIDKAPEKAGNGKPERRKRPVHPRRKSK